MVRTTGVLLAAGAGRRYGRPKALVPGWLAGSVAALRDGGCDDLLVVLGAEAEAARRLVSRAVRIVVADDWATGQSASLRAGLSAVEGSAALIHLVDLPDVGAAVVRRVLEHATDDALVRASFGGRPGHPVLVGRAHWAGVLAAASGDTGARPYLAAHAVTPIECGDLATGRDVDLPPAE